MQLYVFNGARKKTSLLWEVAPNLCVFATMNKKTTGGLARLSGKGMNLLSLVSLGIQTIYILQQRLLMVNAEYSQLSSRVWIQGDHNRALQLIQNLESKLLSLIYHLLGHLV